MSEQTNNQEPREIAVENSAEFPHVKWIELKQGVMTECAVMKEDQYGNLYYFELSKLDDIDKGRLHKILMNRHANTMPLWDLMSNHTLANGMNALNYFHQLVKVITRSGVITNPRAGQIGRSAGTRQMAPAPAAPAQQETPAE